MGFKQYLTESSKDITVFFDMDGVLADFQGMALQHNPDWTEEQLASEVISDEEFWPNIIKIEKFWERLEPLQAGMKLLRYCQAQGFDIQILSSPSSHDKRSIEGKKKWIKKHLTQFDISKVNLVRASKKQEFAGPNAVLVDDLEKNIKQFNSKGGNTVHFHHRDGQALNKLKKVVSSMNLTEAVSKNEFEDMLDKISKGVDVKPSKHFFDRINDRDINLDMVVKTLEKFMKHHQNTISRSARGKLTGLIKDVMTHLNIPMSYDTKGTPTPEDDVMNLITVMRKRNFVPNNPRDIVYSVRR